MKHTFLLLSILLLIASCKKADVDCEDTNYTYNTDVKTIIDKNCNVAGCHNGSGNIGDFSNYAGMKTMLDNGEIYNRVITVGDMPKFRVLSFKNKSILQCWMEDGFPEN